MTHEVQRPIFEDQPPQKSVEMPESKRIIQKLKKAGLYGSETPEETREFYDWLAGSVGRTNRTGESLNYAWVSALTHTISVYSEQDRIDEQFGVAIDAITPDPEVARDAIKTWTRIKEETRQKALR